MSEQAATAIFTRERLDSVLSELRPKLHRYCARMTGSVIDAEDIVQEAIVKAIEAFPKQDRLLTRKAGSFALRTIRRSIFFGAAPGRRPLVLTRIPKWLCDPIATVDDRLSVATSLRTFMRLPVAQRSSVILMDVLGYSLGEVSNILDNGIPAVKAALHRGRVRLREIAQEPDDSPLPVLADSERALLAAYVARFNARDFDTIRTMLADEVRLDLVTKLRRSGRSEVTNYFSRYSEIDDWHFVPGLVERRPAVIVRDPRTASRTPSYFILLEWAGDRLVNIRDFRFARYATEGAELFVME